MKRWQIFLIVLFVPGPYLVTAEWDVTRGPPTAWKFQERELECEITSQGPHWVLSEQRIAGHWVLEAKLEASESGASRGVLFTVGHHGGYALTLREKELRLLRFAPVSATAIRDDFNGDLSQWTLSAGNPEVREGKLVFNDESSRNGNIGIHSQQMITTERDIEAVLRLRNFSGTGGYQCVFRLSNGANSVGIQRRGGAFGSDYRLSVHDGSRGWESFPIGAGGRDFDLKLTYSPVSGLFSGYYDVLDGKGWVKIADTSKSSVTFSTFSTVGFASNGGTVVLPPNATLKPGVSAFGTNAFNLEVDGINMEQTGPPAPDAVSFSQPILSWPVKVDDSPSARTVRIAKRGGTYTFSVDGKPVGTITNPKVRSVAEFSRLLSDPEPDAGFYGFAFNDVGRYTVSDIRVDRLELAKKYSGNPVLPANGPKGEWDDRQSHTMTVKRFGDVIYLYYTGLGSDAAKHGHNEGGAIGVATSRDGYHFTKSERNPIYLRIDPKTGEKQANMQGGAVIALPDGRYAITYTVRDHELKRWLPIEYAVGPTPIGPFELGPANPIITCGKREEFDGEHVTLHDVIKMEDGTYILMYTGFTIDCTNGCRGDEGGLAMSPDFTEWEKFSGNPVFPLGKPGTWDDGHVRPKGVVKVGEWYYMFYEGAHRSEIYNYFFDQVGMARSRDLMEWERFPHNPIVPIDAGGGRDTIVTEWPSPLLTEKGIALYYWGGHGGNVAISRADISWELLEKW